MALITGTPQKAAVIIVYAILFSAVVTIPLNMAKYFQNPKTYKFYKLFWWLAALIFAYLLLLLSSIGNISDIVILHKDYMTLYIILVMFILTLTLAPAAYQYNTNMSAIKRWVLRFIMLIPFIIILWWWFMQSMK